ncbi:MAG TPA: HNH endonuclease signature motif containing protein [Verrucomicrobiae bacterium]
MGTPNKNWSREEHILAFNLYSKIPFGQFHQRNPKVIYLAHLLGRTPGSVAMKLSNFARLDPTLQARGIAGMKNGAKGEMEIWQQFASEPEALAFESELLLAERQGKTVEQTAQIKTDDLPLPGREREATVRVRVNQAFFRDRILSAYNFRCCVTGLAIPSLLTASHIIPWSEDVKNRLNTQNGLCLNALHDRAFDRRLMWIDANYLIRFSRQLTQKINKGDAGLDWLVSFEGQTLQVAGKFRPSPELLAKHASQCTN